MSAKVGIIIIGSAAVIVCAVFLLLPGGETPGKMIVAAHYVPWYRGADNGDPWTYERINGPLRTAFTPLLGQYDCRDPHLLSQHIDWALQYGINTFMIEWCGREHETFTDSQDDIVNSYLRNPDFRRIKFFFVYSLVSATRREGEQAFHSVRIDDPQLRDKILGDLRYASRTYLNQPNYLRLLGRPALFLFATNLMDGDTRRFLREIRETIRSETGLSPYLIADQVGWGSTYDPQRTPLYDAVMPYAAINHQTPANAPVELGAIIAETIDQYRRWENATEDLGIDFIPSVFPGFNAVGAPWCYDTAGALAVPTIRRDPKAFRTFLRQALELIDPQVRMIGITSFNEWNEGTNVEPSTELGFSALEVIRQETNSARLAHADVAVIRFSYTTLFDPPGTDDRLLGAAFDFVDFLGADGATLVRIDLGTPQAHEVMGIGWYDDEQNWDSTASYVWGGTVLRASTLHANLPKGAFSLRIRLLLNDDSPIRVTANDRPLGEIHPTGVRQWFTVTLPLPQPPGRSPLN